MGRGVLLEEVEEEDFVVGLPVGVDDGEAQPLDDLVAVGSHFQFGETPHAPVNSTAEDGHRPVDLLATVATEHLQIGLVDQLASHLAYHYAVMLRNLIHLLGRSRRQIDLLVLHDVLDVQRVVVQEGIVFVLPTFGQHLHHGGFPKLLNLFKYFHRAFHLYSPNSSKLYPLQLRFGRSWRMNGGGAREGF